MITMTRLLCYFALLTFLQTAHAAPTPNDAPALSARPTPAAPAIAARAYVLIDIHSQRVLAESHANERMEPASLTKLMTAYSVFKELAAGKIKLSDQATISEKAWRTEGSRMFVKVNTQVSLEDLLKGMIIQSGNDASVALAEHVAGTEEGFATLMNQHAQELGMVDSHFTNSTGLPDPELYVTAHDIALLTRAIILEFPDYYAWYSTKEFTYNNITQFNRNQLLWRDQGVDGVKTGHTDSAGFCLVSSALRDGMRLISVVLGTKDEKARAQESLAILNYGFRFFETHRLYAAGQELYTLPVWKGAERTLRLGLNHDLYVTVPRDQYKNLSASMDMHARIIAPVAKNQSFGNVTVSLAGDTIAKPPLVALHEVAQGSLWRRLIDTIRLWWN